MRASFIRDQVHQEFRTIMSRPIRLVVRPLHRRLAVSFSGEQAFAIFLAYPCHTRRRKCATTAYGTVVSVR